MRYPCRHKRLFSVHNTHYGLSALRWSEAKSGRQWT